MTEAERLRQGIGFRRGKVLLKIQHKLRRTAPPFIDTLVDITHSRAIEFVGPSSCFSRRYWAVLIS